MGGSGRGYGAVLCRPCWESLCSTKGFQSHWCGAVLGRPCGRVWTVAPCLPKGLLWPAPGEGDPAAPGGRWPGGSLRPASSRGSGAPEPPLRVGVLGRPTVGAGLTTPGHPTRISERRYRGKRESPPSRIQTGMPVVSPSAGPLRAVGLGLPWVYHDLLSKSLQMSSSSPRHSPMEQPALASGAWIRPWVDAVERGAASRSGWS